jgi:elongation factor Ts
VVAVYVHGQVAPNLGRIGVLVALKSTGDRGKLQQIGRQVAMHVAAASPLALKPDELDKDVVARERAVFAEQARASGKPESIIEKMVDGRMRKYYAEVVLLEQAFVHEPDITVGAAVKKAEAEVGAPISVEGFRILKVGEGVEKADSDFAAEVAAAAKG